VRRSSESIYQKKFEEELNLPSMDMNTEEPSDFDHQCQARRKGYSADSAFEPLALRHDPHYLVKDANVSRVLWSN
jgi:hypothetical protein